MSSFSRKLFTKKQTDLIDRVFIPWFNMTMPFGIFFGASLGGAGALVWAIEEDFPPLLSTSFPSMAMEALYLSSRFGISVVGGAAAGVILFSTAPITLPIYAYYRQKSKYDRDNTNSNNETDTIKPIDDDQCY